MPDLQRLCLAAATAVLLAAIAGGQPSSPFPQPPRMPPEIASPTALRFPPAVIQAQPVVDFDNAQLRVLRFHAAPRTIVNLVPSSAPGELLVAVTPLTLRTSTAIYQMKAGETRWLTLPGRWIHNLGTEPCEFLLVQPKRN